MVWLSRSQRYDTAPGAIFIQQHRNQFYNLTSSLINPSPAPRPGHHSPSRRQRRQLLAVSPLQSTTKASALVGDVFTKPNGTTTMTTIISCTCHGIVIALQRRAPPPKPSWISLSTGNTLSNFVGVVCCFPPPVIFFLFFRFVFSVLGSLALQRRKLRALFTSN